MGGSGADRFRFVALSDSTAAVDGRDTITDFRAVSGDRIDLWVIDANRALAGNQAFTFVGTKAFSGGAGELRYERTGKDVVVFADTNRDKAADFSLKLTGTTALATSDFML